MTSETAKRAGKKPAPVPMTDDEKRNSFRICEFKTSYGSTVTVYLLNSGDYFPGFGGSRHGLVVGKGASLITREMTRDGVQLDRELQINASSADRYGEAAARTWQWIFHHFNAGRIFPEPMTPNED